MNKLNVLKALDLIFPSNCAEGWSFSFVEETHCNGSRTYVKAVFESGAFLHDQIYNIGIGGCKTDADVVEKVISYLKGDDKQPFRIALWKAEEEI